MNKIAPRNPDWLALHDNVEVREAMLEMTASGLTDYEIAEYMRSSGLVDRITPEDVAYYKQHNVRDITAYIQKHAKEIVGGSLRSQKPYRIGEMNRLADSLIRSIPQWLESKPNIAASLVKVYLQTLQQIATETGDLQGVQEPRNIWIETLQRADPQQKMRIMQALADLDEVTRQVGQPKLPDAHVVDVYDTGGE